MKPIKSIEGFAKWMLRSSVLLFIIFYFYEIVKTFNFESVYYLVVLLFFVFGVLLFAGGFRKNASLTVISGLMVFLISLFFIARGYHGLIIDKNLIVYIFPASVGLFFLSKGNA